MTGNIGSESSKGSISFDTRPLLGGGGKISSIDLRRIVTVNELLDRVYFDLLADFGVPRYTYSRVWALKDSSTGKVYSEMGRNWKADMTEESADDERSYDNLGIHSGQTLEVIEV